MTLLAPNLAAVIFLQLKLVSFEIYVDQNSACVMFNISGTTAPIDVKFLTALILTYDITCTKFDSCHFNATRIINIFV